MRMDSHRKILNYQEGWKSKFEKEKHLLEKSLEGLFLSIEHIGSTSVPGLSSKPIIDIAIVIEKYEDRDKLTEALINLGYIQRSPGNERNFFEKGDPIEYHVSVCFTDRGGFYIRQVLFRDYLIDNSEARIAYDELKRKELGKDPTGYDTYMSGKTDFVYDILEKAGWNQENDNYFTYKEKQKTKK